MATHLTILRVFLLAITFGVSFAQNSRKELRTKETNQEQIIRLGHHTQPKTVDPSQVVQLSWQPRVFLYRDFLSEEECDYLISRGDDSSKIDTNKDEIATRIEERISAWTFLPKENSKSLQVLHLGPEDPKQNYNYFHNESVTEQVGQPLLATVILYLSNVTEGGQILFPQSEKTMWSDCTKSSNILKPRKGNAIVFFNLHLNATPDTSSVHARCPVLRGEIWFATKFFYLKGIVSVQKELSRSDDGDCTDEDDSCPRWAAIGECQRNSIFMIGSPDYYGSCRKSCNAC